MRLFAQALSAALLHFVWQGTLVACLLWCLLFALRKRSASLRYVLSSMALVALALLPAVTTWILYQRSEAIQVSALLLDTVSQTIGNAWRADTGQSSWTEVFRSIERWALPIWSLGVLVFSLRVVWCCAEVSKLRRRGEPAGAAVVAMIARLAQRAGLKRPIRVMVSAIADSPSVIGWIRPVILLPAATLLGLTQEQLEAVIAHELAHIRRYDHLVNVAQVLVETLLFYHPAVWWTSTRIRHERELCCDDLAVRSCGDALCYARALTRLERLRMLSPSVAVGSTGGSLLYRIQRLMGANTAECAPSKVPGILALSLGLICLGFHVSWAGGRAQDAPEPLAKRAVVFNYNNEGERSKTAKVWVAEPQSFEEQSQQHNLREMRRSLEREIHAAERDPGGAHRAEELRRILLKLPVPDTRMPGMLAGRKLREITVRGLSDSRQAGLLARLPVSVGSVLTNDAIERIAPAVRSFDEHLRFGLIPRGDGEAILRIVPAENGERIRF